MATVELCDKRVAIGRGERQCLLAGACMGAKSSSMLIPPVIRERREAVVLDGTAQLLCCVLVLECGVHGVCVCVRGSSQVQVRVAGADECGRLSTAGKKDKERKKRRERKKEEGERKLEPFQHMRLRLISL